jgi:hypothetical protein
MVTFYLQLLTGSQKEVAIDVPKVGAVIMQCRICLKKGEHWTAKCPLKDISQRSVIDSIDSQVLHS